MFMLRNIKFCLINNMMPVIFRDGGGGGGGGLVHTISDRTVACKEFISNCEDKKKIAN